MEQKTIGKFITALRKANGMTQKDLAEQLNVSDKTVSRWERDEGTPDLSVIPVIAEIFGVTCDELLRGERKSPTERSDVSEESEMTPKGEKQLQRLLKSTLSQYQSRTYIAMGISGVGMIVALICNLAFLKAVLGFLFGAIFFVASIVCQAVFVNRAYLSVEDTGMELRDILLFKQKVVWLAEKSIGLTVAFIGFTLPLISMDAYVGLSADNMFLFGIVGAAVFLLLYAVVLYFLNVRFLIKEVYSLNEKAEKKYWYNHKLIGKCTGILAVVLAITFVAHQAATTIWGPFSIMEGTTFHDYDSFVAFMEQDIKVEPKEQFAGGTTAIDQAAPEEAIPGTTTYYDQYGNEISEEEAFHRTLEDIDGNVVCEYQDRNESVVSMRYTPKEGTVLPITVHTQDELDEAREVAAIRHVIFAGVYGVEVIAMLLIYLKKREK